MAGVGAGEIGGNRLPALASEIRKAHASARDYQRRTLDQAVSAGELLIEAKVLVQHGGWLPWLREHCEMSERTAQLYMRLAKNKGELKNRNVADLSIRGAVAAIDKRLDSDVDPRDCLPPSGHHSIGTGGGDEMWVVPSYQHPGFFYLTHIMPDGENWTVRGTNKPVRADWVPFMVRHFMPNVGLIWRTDPGAPWTYNIFLHTGVNAYVESITDLRTAADIAHGRPPTYPDIDDDARVGLAILQGCTA